MTPTRAGRLAALCRPASRTTRRVLLLALAIVALASAGDAALAADQTVTITNALTYHCADVPNASSTPGQSLQHYYCNGTNAQKFALRRNVDNSWRFVNVSSGLCLDVRDASRSAGAAVQQYVCNGTPAQNFRLSPVAGGVGAAYLVNVNSNLCVGPAGGSVSPMASLQQSACNGANILRYRLQPIPVLSEEFNTLSLYNKYKAGSSGVWSPASWYAPNDNGFQLNDGWVVNPFNSSTPYPSLYSVSSGMALLGAQKRGNCATCGTAQYLTSQIVARNMARLTGYFEARLAVPHIIGTNFAFWLLPTAPKWPPEINVIEIAATQDGKQFGVHTLWDGVNARIAKTCYTFNTFPGYVATQFHTYGVDWTPTTVTFYIDRRPLCTAPTPAGYDSPMFPLLSWQQAGSWTGPIPPNATLAPMRVDYVKVWSARPF